MAETALTQAQLDSILWIPAGDPPHKPLAAGATTAQRVEMVKRAIQGYPRFQYCGLEVERPGRSYALLTVMALQEQHPQDEWFWIIGADAFADLPKWYQVEALVERVTWLLAPRAETADVRPLLEAVAGRIGKPLRVVPLLMPAVAISSTEIREACRRGESIRAYVPPAVASYIEEQQLYQESHHAPQHEK